MGVNGVRTKNDEPPANGPNVTFTRREWAPELCVLEVGGDLDLSSSPLLLEELDEVLGLGFWRVEVDLSGVQFMDSSALSSLVHAHEDAKATGQLFNVRSPSPPCAKVLRITGLDHVFGLS